MTAAQRDAAQRAAIVRAYRAAGTAYDAGRPGTRSAYDRAYRAARAALLPAGLGGSWWADRIASYFEAHATRPPQTPPEDAAPCGGCGRSGPTDNRGRIAMHRRTPGDGPVCPGSGLPPADPCAHAGVPCSPAAGDCLCDCPPCTARWAVRWTA